MTGERMFRRLSLAGLAALALACEAPEGSATDGATAGQSELDRPGGRRAPRGGQPPANQPPQNQPPAEQPPQNQPPAEQPPQNQPPAEQPPADDPPANDPPADDPAPAPAPPADPNAFVVPAPGANPTTDEKVELGRLLFWDPILSGNRDVSCATCHHPQFGYADGLQLSRGVGGRGVGPQRRGGALADRNAPTVLLTGLNGWVDPNRLPNPTRAPMFWDIRARSLEVQALGPIANAAEMAGDAYPPEDAVDIVVARLADVPEYRRLFANAFDLDPAEAVSPQTLAWAIAAFERSLSIPSSAYDRWLDGDDSAMTAQQVRGLDALHEARCTTCHAGPMFSDYRLHRLGVPDNPARNTPDTGDGEFRFRTPTLRNVAATGPYMHGGTLGSLQQVMGFYRARAGGGGPGGPGGPGGGGPGGPPPPPGAGPLDPLLAQVRLNPQREADIIAFLRALNDEDVDRRRPAAVPSGLPVGGR